MNKQRFAVCLAALASSLPLSAQANNFDYNFFEVRMGMSPETAGVEASTLLTENLHLVGRIDSKLDHDWDAAAGIGFNGPINQFADVYGQLLVHNIQESEEDGDDNNTQAEINIGVRLWLSDQLEATGRIGKNDERSVFHAGVRFHSTNQLSLSAEARNNGVYGPQAVMSVRFQY